jgi:hypothetical protein
LESIARTFPDGSEQSKAIEEAATAYIFFIIHMPLRNSFHAVRRTRLGLDALTEDQ